MAGPKQLAAAAAKATRYANGVPNTIPAVVIQSDAHPYVYLRPDQDWLRRELRERGVPYILVQESWQPGSP